ncbi:MAG: nodulation protein NfeD, partial [Rhodothalassiaceae bacterium]
MTGRLLLVALVLVLGPAAGALLPDQTTPPPRHALLAAIEGPVGPATARSVADAIGAAEEGDAAVLILRLDTPGGLVTATREIVSAILASRVPVIGHVAPAGAHAASAGTYILYATHLAAMAPGTNLGAATPVSLGGLPGTVPDSPPGEEGKHGGEAPPPDSASALRAKQINDAVAWIRSLAEFHGRNADWAEEAVRKGASLTANAALERAVIELIAADAEQLLAAADGRSVRLQSGPYTLHTAGLALEPFEPGAVTRFLAVLANPNVAFILMLIGIYGLIFEFSNPGSVAPGVIGAIALVLGLYALHQLPLDYAGLALLLLGIALMVAEAFTPSFGILGIGGLAAFVLGAAMLIDTDIPAFRIDWTVIGVMAATSGAILVLL